MRTPSQSQQQASFAAKAKDLQALRDAVVEAATVSGPLWISYLFVFFYLAIAAGGVTHRDLFFENPVKLPFLNVDLPLIGFFVLGPLLFLIVHAYTLLHFALLAGKVGAFHTELEDQIRHHETRSRLRRQLPSNIFVQFLAGPRDVRTGVFGLMLQSIAWISLVIGPIALLVLFQLQFLAYHDPVVTWWQRITVLIDLLLLWALWPRIARGTGLRWRDFARSRVVGLVALSFLPALLVLTVATFPGEWLNEKLPAAGKWLDKKLPAMPFVAAEWTPHKLLVAGNIDPVARRPQSPWSNRLVLSGIKLNEQARFDSEVKIAALSSTVSLRGRHLEEAVLSGADLRKADFTGAHLTNAVLREADLRQAKFECAKAEPGDTSGKPGGCANLRRALLNAAQLQGTSFDGARLEGALLLRAQLQGASLNRAQLQGAVFSIDDRMLPGPHRGNDGPKLQGASLIGAELQGAFFQAPEFQGATLDGAQLQGAFFPRAQLQGASFPGAQLQGASLDRAQLQGATIVESNLEAASLARVFVWRSDTRGVNAQHARVTDPGFAGEKKGQNCRTWPWETWATWDWSASTYAELVWLVENAVPGAGRRSEALGFIQRLSPTLARDWNPKFWTELKQSPPAPEEYEKALALTLRQTGCAAENAPYVISGLLRTLDRRFIVDRSQLAKLAAAFLDEAHCPGAHGLSEHDKLALQKLRGPTSPAAVATTAPPKP